jgi:hypothetical protein
MRDNFEPTYEWDEYDCELNFELKDLKYNYDLFEIPVFNTPFEEFYLIRAISNTVPDDYKNVFVSSLTCAYFLFQHIYKFTKKGDVVCLYNHKETIIIHKVNDEDDEKPREYYRQAKSIYSNKR